MGFCSGRVLLKREKEFGKVVWRDVSGREVDGWRVRVRRRGLLGLGCRVKGIYGERWISDEVISLFKIGSTLNFIYKYSPSPII